MDETTRTTASRDTSPNSATTDAPSPGPAKVKVSKKAKEAKDAGVTAGTTSTVRQSEAATTGVPLGEGSAPEGTPSVRHRNPRGQGDRLRADLIEATIELMARTGDPDEITLRAVARQAGVAPNSIYRHFEDRDALVQAACEELFAEFQQSLDDAAEGATDCFDELRRRGGGYAEYAMAEHGHYRVLFSSKTPTAITDFGDSAGAQSFFRIIELIQRCIDAGAQPGADATAVAFDLFSSLHGIVDLRITHTFMPWPPMDEMLDRLQTRLGLDRPT